MKPIAEAFENLSPEVRAELLRPAQSRDPRYAEMVEGLDPRWHVVEVFASAQVEVAETLAQHRFGVYVPEVEETVVRRGRKLDRRVPMFSGYLFVFMWYSDAHWQCISSIPGVVEIVGALTDAEIDIVRTIENMKRPVFIEVAAEIEPEPQPAARTKSKKKRRWKNRKAAKAKSAKPKVITDADRRAEIITTRAWSAFDDILQLDSEGRNQTLMRALGLS
ncbi:transcription termination/antitermination NusG family protein [Bradyrhizobium sp. 173]|uniref:transcription termination/antitermination protein NusG n=1 Tax=Bradyrhizobium sp. 173 TaxID=2782644 RepID=UPI001FFB816E|nr:transcription termination/antitermination NusG family protein [Bradyrhizobium sp. 173]MCK1568968.1 transcription termination/antitermination NusG family protein [Bradyrhizobium sp. 173]